ncbi:MAG TPA: Na+/H+ antiporter NhaA [Frankiaceae bacterium]|nr:Na+/H+ antiporter NhaA [Frankiaceae bacterium]
MTADPRAHPLTERTAWLRRSQVPLRNFLSTETGSAAVLLAAVLAALAWANLASGSYTSVWDTVLSIRVGNSGPTQTLREWINSGLMTFFFFVVGLEARREFDLGELRDRRRVVVPLAAGVGGMLIPILIYLTVNAGRPSSHGWGAAMSTDTAFALGLFVVVARHLPERVRAFLLTVVVVDDVVALAVIATMYSEKIALRPLLVALALFGVVLLARAWHVRNGMVYAALGLVTWVALFDSGIDPVVVGLVFGLVTLAYAPTRNDLEQATGLFRDFREQPTPEFARTASAGLQAAVSPNDRLQQLYHPWTSYLVVPLFALANAGIEVSRDFLSSAVTSPITLGILIAYVVGKPIGIIAFSWLTTWLSRGRFAPPVGWAAIAGSGSIAGIGFTVSLLISTLAFRGVQLQEAKLGVLSAAVFASLGAWVIFRLTDLLSPTRRNRAVLGTADALIDLSDPVDPERDHIRGPAESLVTLVEYGDFECPYCGQAEPIVRSLLADHGEVRYVWRHLPLTDVHPHAQLAAEATEAAGRLGKFWEMHDLLLTHQEELRAAQLIGHAATLGLDLERFSDDLRAHAGAERVAVDVESADLSGVSGTPTFFINGQRHQGAYDIDTLTAAVRAAKLRAYAAAAVPTS